MDRDNTIREIRAALKRRSGKAWSVTGGRGTAWGWITITAPPARCTWRSRLRAGLPDVPASYEPYDSGEPGRLMSPADGAELAALLGLAPHETRDGVGIPAGSDYWREYIDRANGREPSVCGRPYWD